mgnify:CR=1 FL=1
MVAVLVLVVVVHLCTSAAPFLSLTHSATISAIISFAQLVLVGTHGSPARAPSVQCCWLLMVVAVVAVVACVAAVLSMPVAEESPASPATTILPSDRPTVAASQAAS